MEAHEGGEEEENDWRFFFNYIIFLFFINNKFNVFLNNYIVVNSVRKNRRLTVSQL